MTTAAVDSPAAVTHAHHRHGWWWKTLVAGLVLWIVTIVVTALTENSNLIPTLILLGSFLVPFSVVLFVVERVRGNVSVLQLILAFFIGGICGVLGASLLESGLTQRVFALYVVVGVIEEFVKAAVLVIVGWRVLPKTAAQGALLGATVGAGFAAFESAGYAFNSVITARGLDLASLLQTEVLRAILAPIGHVLWTAIIGAVIFGASRTHKKYRWSWFILLAYAGSVTLHGLWDSLSDITTTVALVFTGNAQTLATGSLVTGTPGAVEALATVLYVVGVVVLGVVGVLALFLILRHATKRDRSANSHRGDPVVAPPIAV
ncbi:PrsW family intramembrane metalloprotease [Lacisediminihabitans changchengi]|uniref:PrsW family intramembrane metalloprotease n=1 Tax=Lacisediminihabitans changchengi TaxID=2787634 RepID=A0A934SNU3_9MICO|nr:PrsW family intramembrane metalloprotease [Lacisediminihabitans changchengi]MBK4348447.1 PrsW family intramembrane metalloprotease [Lacisediminihabitans changchengi]